MTEVISGILGAFGLSVSAGLNAYIPLLVVSLLAKFTDLIELAKPWDALESWWTIGVLVVLVVIEAIAEIRRTLFMTLVFTTIAVAVLTIIGIVHHTVDCLRVIFGLDVSADGSHDETFQLEDCELDTTAAEGVFVNVAGRPPVPRRFR